MKDKLLKLLAAKEARKVELNTRSNASTDLVEVRSIGQEIDAINIEIAEFRSMIAGIPDETPPAVPGVTATVPIPEQRQVAIPQGQLNVLGTYGVAAVPGPVARSEERSLDDIIKLPKEEMRGELFGMAEYRSGYLKSLQGKQLTEVEQRAITTAAGSGGAAVPTTTYDMIIKKLQQVSVLFPLISVTYIPGNVTLPVANAKTAALWSDEVFESNGSTGDDTVAGVSLSGFTLAKYAKVSAAAMAMTISAFETYLVGQISDQLAIAIENAILNGLGPTPGGALKPQPTGIMLGVTWGVDNSVTWPLADPLGYDDLVDARALLKTPYRPFAKWVMNSNMEAALFKVKDLQGRPIFTQSPQNGFEPRILNHPYIVDDYMPDNTVMFAALNYYYMNFS